MSKHAVYGESPVVSAGAGSFRSTPGARQPRVLLAEDDDGLRALMASALRERGYSVVEAGDGNSLIDCFVDSLVARGEGSRFDVVVSDVRMPGMSAFDILIGMRPVLSRTPVVFVTAFGDRYMRERAERLGAAKVLDKPIAMDEFCRAVAAVLPKERN